MRLLRRHETVKPGSLVKAKVGASFALVLVLKPHLVDGVNNELSSLVLASNMPRGITSLKPGDISDDFSLLSGDALIWEPGL